MLEYGLEVRNLTVSNHTDTRGDGLTLGCPVYPLARLHWREPQPNLGLQQSLVFAQYLLGVSRKFEIKGRGAWS